MSHLSEMYTSKYITNFKLGYLGIIYSNQALHGVVAVSISVLCPINVNNPARVVPHLSYLSRFVSVITFRDTPKSQNNPLS